MKVKLLRRLRRQVPIYYSREKDILDSDTKKPIKGRFLVEDPLERTKYYSATRERAVIRRRLVILNLLTAFRVKHYWTTKIIKI